MRTYELMMIVKPDLEDDATRGVVDKTLAVVSNNGGTVEKEDIWGKRRLAYEINHQRDGFYAVITYKGTPALTAEVDRLLKIDDNVVRHLIVRPDEDD